MIYNSNINDFPSFHLKPVCEMSFLCQWCPILFYICERFRKYLLLCSVLKINCVKRVSTFILKQRAEQQMYT